MIIAYSTRHRGYTAYGFPIRIKDPTVAMPFRQLTGYHPTPQDAREWARKGPGRSISSAHPSEAVGTITARLSKSQPEMQDPNHRHRPDPRMADIATMDYSEIERRTMAHYSQEMTATQAAEARDKFNKAYPGVKQAWEDMKDNVAKEANIPRRMLDEPATDQQRPPAGVSKSPPTQERASSAPNRRQRAPK